MTDKEASIAKPKVLFLDLEIAKSLYAKFPPKHPEFDSYKNIIVDWWIICAAWKWQDEKTVHSVSVLDKPELFNKNHTNDYHVVKTVYDLIEKADVLIGHNLERFDWPKFYARVLYHNLPPLKKPRIIDTIKMARSVGEFSSSSLDYLTSYFTLTKKLDNRGNEMWNDLIAALISGDTELMIKIITEIEVYCRGDILPCVELHDKLLPHVSSKNKVNLNVGDNCCPSCAHDKLVKRGFRYTATGVYQAYQCKGCGAYSQSKSAISISGLR